MIINTQFYTKYRLYNENQIYLHYYFTATTAAAQYHFYYYCDT